MRATPRPSTRRSSRLHPRLATLALAGAMATALLPTPARAQNLFVISGTSDGSPFTPIGADNIIDLVGNAVNNEDQFAFLANTQANLTLNYGGIADAITISKNAANSQATLTFINPDGSRTTRNFDTAAPDANGRSLEDLVTDYLKKDGSADLASFFQAVNAQSLIAVSDGNPNATTARMAEATFDRFGRYNRQTAMWAANDQHDGTASDGTPGEQRTRKGAGAQFRVSALGNAFEAGDFDGNSATIISSLDWNFSPRLGVSFGTHVGFNTIADANVFHFGATLGLPIRILLPSESLPLTWQVTPSGSVAGSGSEDLGAGGLVYSGAATSLLRWDVTNRLALEMSNQYGIYEGEELSFGDYSIDPGVSQSILKNGLHAQFMLGSESAWYVYGGATYTNFLDDAAVEGYLTPAAGFGWRKPSLKGTSLEIGFTGDFGEDWTSYGLRAGFNFAF